MGDLKQKRGKKEYEKIKNEKAMPVTEYVLQCKQDQIRKYVKSQIGNPNFKVSPSLQVPRAKKKEFKFDSLKIEESYTEKTNRINKEKKMAASMLADMLNDDTFMRQGTQFVSQMKRKHSLLLE